MAQESSPSLTQSGPPTIHTVDVGKGYFMYEPNETYAKPGDIVTFSFFPTNHSVTRAAYGLPCIPYENTGRDLVGFNSGGRIVDSLIDPPQWNLTINDTQPVFYYCTAIDSCKVQGMVGVINPNASVSLHDQYVEALKSPYMLVPGQPFPNEGESTRPHLTANANLLTATPTGDASATAAAVTLAPAEHHGSHLSGGAIAGIVIAAVAFLALLAGFFWLLGNRKGLGSATAGQSMLGKGHQERTEQWANASSNGPWGGASEAGAPPRGEMSQRDVHSPVPSGSYMNPLASPGYQSHMSEAPPYSPPAAPQPTELGNNQVIELEAPHTMKH